MVEVKAMNHPAVPCQHIAAYYQQAWEDHKCIGYNLLRQGYAAWADTKKTVYEHNNLYEFPAILPHFLRETVLENLGRFAICAGLYVIDSHNECDIVSGPYADQPTPLASQSAPTSPRSNHDDDD